MSVAPIRTLKRNGGGAKITYYDGTTELGYAYVATGLSVLHPSITVPSKTGKTFVGWSTTTSETNWVSELLANGQPMNLYAIYADSSIVVANGTLESGLSPTYTPGSKNTKYLTGDIGGNAYVWYTTSTDEKTWTFVLDKKFYQTASLVAKTEKYGQGGGSKFDDNSFSGTLSQTINNGTHTLYASAIHSGTSGWTQNACGIISLTLSNPQAWT